MRLSVTLSEPRYGLGAATPVHLVELSGHFFDDFSAMLAKALKDLIFDALHAARNACMSDYRMDLNGIVHNTDECAKRFCLHIKSIECMR